MWANKEPGFYGNDIHGNPITDPETGEPVAISPWKEEWSKLRLYPDEDGNVVDHMQRDSEPLHLGRRVELFDVIDKILWMFSLTEADWEILDEKYPPESYQSE